MAASPSRVSSWRSALESRIVTAPAYSLSQPKWQQYHVGSLCQCGQALGRRQRRQRQRQQQQQQQPQQQKQHAAVLSCRSAGRSMDEIPVLSDEDAPESDCDNQQPGPRGQPSGSSSSGSGGGSMRRDVWRVPLPPHLHGKAPRKHWNANALAFLGDSVWELYTRRRFFYPPSRRDSYFSLVVHHVRAETQEKLYKQLLGSGFLTAVEQDVLRWGRNATGVTPKRLADTGLKRETYRAATAIECLTGYLYLSDPERLHDMMCLLGLGDAPPEDGGSASLSGNLGGSRVDRGSGSGSSSSSSSLGKVP